MISIEFSEEELILLETAVRKKKGFRQDPTFDKLLFKIQKALNYGKRQFNKSVYEMQEW